MNSSLEQSISDVDASFRDLTFERKSNTSMKDDDDDDEDVQQQQKEEEREKQLPFTSYADTTDHSNFTSSYYDSKTDLSDITNCPTHSTPFQRSDLSIEVMRGNEDDDSLPWTSERLLPLEGGNVKRRISVESGIMHLDSTR